MAKDPAFLFYPNDWIGGTMGMTLEEKGAYMEVLMMQFNRGHMTEHMIGLTVGQLFGRIKDKFTQDKDGLWFNERLEEEKEKRKKFVNSRKNNKLGTNQYNNKKEKQSGHMTQHMENEDVNRNIILNNTLPDFQKKQKEDMVVVEMMKTWMKHNPNYFEEKENDYTACLQIAYKIAKYKKWKEVDVVGLREKDVLNSWDKICLFIRSDQFLKKLSVTNICNQFQLVVQKMNNPTENEIKPLNSPVSSQTNPTIKPATDEMVDKYRKPNRNAVANN